MSFHGTGDVFASPVVGALTNGRRLSDALAIAVDYTLECLKETLRDPDHRTYGVNFESAIPYLIGRMPR